MKKYSFFVLGTLIGGLVGTVLAMLFAPASGENLRLQISNYRQKTIDEVRSAALRRRAELEAELTKLRQPRPR